MTDSSITETKEAEEKLDFKKILPVFVIVFIDLLGLTIIIPLLPLYAAASGANPFVIGLLGATYPILQFFGAPLLGRLSDRYGRRPVLIVSQIGTLVGFLMLGFANSLLMLFLSRVVDGISGANIATAQAVITDSTTRKTRTQGLGLIGAAFGLGFIVGPIIAFVTLGLSDNNFALTAFVAAGFSLISILLTVFWLEESLPPERRGQDTGRAALDLRAMLDALKRPSVGFLLALMFAQQFAFGGFEQLLALFTLSRLGLDATGNSALFIYAGAIVVVVQGGLVGRWSRRFGDRWLVLMGLLVLGAGLIFAALTVPEPVPWYSSEQVTENLTGSTTIVGEAIGSGEIQVDIPDETQASWRGFIWLLIALVPISVGGGVLQPSINSMITKRVHEDEVGGTLGISSSFSSAANAVAPVILGAIFYLLGSTAPFLIGGIIVVLLFLVARRNIE